MKSKKLRILNYTLAAIGILITAAVYSRLPEQIPTTGALMVPSPTARKAESGCAADCCLSWHSCLIICRKLIRAEEIM